MASLLSRACTPYSLRDAATRAEQALALGNMFAALRFHISVVLAGGPNVTRGANAFDLFADIEIPKVEMDAEYDTDEPGPHQSAN